MSRTATATVPQYRVEAPARSRPLRRHRRAHAPLPSWKLLATVPPSIVAASGGREVPPARQRLFGFAVLAVIVHALIVVTAYQLGREAPKPKPREVAMEFVKPPEPPKVEPPKPEPPKPQPQQQAVQPQPTVPPIETATPEPSAEAAPANAEVVAAPVAGPPPAELPVTPAMGRAGYLNNPPPQYPATASRQGWEGTVLLRVRVLASGKVDTVEVQKSSGRKLLDDEALRTVRSWLFSPSKRGEVAIDGWATVPIEFKLDA